MHIVLSAESRRRESSAKSTVRSRDSKHCNVLHNHLFYLAAQNGRIATPEDIEQWDLGLQAAKIMLRCLHVTVLKLWGMRHNHLILNHHADDDFIARLEASGEVQMARTATHMKSMTEVLGVHCLATAVTSPHGVKLFKCPSARANRAPVEGFSANNEKYIRLLSFMTTLVFRWCGPLLVYCFLLLRRPCTKH